MPHLEGASAPLLALTSANPDIPPQAYNFYTAPPEVPTYVPLPAVRSQAFHMPQPQDDEVMAELMQRIDAFDLETFNREQVSCNLHMDVHNCLEAQPKEVINHLATLQQDQQVLPSQHVDLQPYALPGQAPLTFERAGVWCGDNQTELFLQWLEVRRITDTMTVHHVAYVRESAGGDTEV